MISSENQMKIHTENAHFDQSDHNSNQSDDNENSNSQGKVQFLFVGHQAGLDKDKNSQVEQVVYEASQNSQYYKRQQQKREHYDQQIKQMKILIDEINCEPQNLQQLKDQVFQKMNQLEKTRLLNRTWVHFDMDMFFVACELLQRPHLNDQPVAVGGQSMVSTANYVARQFGVRSAMPGFIAQKLCPDLIFIGHHGELYQRKSKIFKDILYRYDKDLESMGGDEANLDMTDYLSQNGIQDKQSILKLCSEIRQEIFEKTGGLTVSCGVAANKMLAKICTDVNKPNGQFYLEPDAEQIKNFMADMPVRKIPGIGNVCEQLLVGIGVKQCGMVVERAHELQVCFSDTSLDFFLSAALGISRCFHEPPQQRQSFSVSRTFTAISTLDQFQNKLDKLSGLLAEELQIHQSMGQNLCVNIKTTKFDVRSKNQRLPKYLDNKEEILAYAQSILREMMPLAPLRLMGLRMTELILKESLETKSLNRYFQSSNQSKMEKKSQTDSMSNFPLDNNSDSEYQLEGVHNFLQEDKLDGKSKQKCESLSKHSNFNLSQLKSTATLTDSEYDSEDELEEIKKIIDETYKFEDVNLPLNSKPRLNERCHQILESVMEQQEQEVQKYQETQLEQQNIIIAPSQIDGQIVMEENIQNQNESLNDQKNDPDAEENSGQQNNNEDEQKINDVVLKSKEMFIPQLFTCPICNKEIDCYANISQMNNHINNCLQSQEVQQTSEILQSNAKNPNFFTSQKPLLNNTNQINKARQIDDNNNITDTQKNKQQKSLGSQLHIEKGGPMDVFIKPKIEKQ